MEIKLDRSNPFQEFVFEQQEMRAAFIPNPAYLAFLQNKIAAYAKDLINAELVFGDDQDKQFQFMKHQLERRAQIRVLQELMAETMAGMETVLDLNKELSGK